MLIDDLELVTSQQELGYWVRDADRAYDKAHEAAKSLGLADKIVALREAKADRVAAYAAACGKEAS